MHRDNYENIYVQVLGQKHFVLLPPLCQPCVNEQPLPQYNYTRRGNGLVLVPEEQDPEAQQEGDEGDNTVPFAVWDPDASDTNTTAYSGLAEPMRVTLNPGDMLYLPAMWYHKVSQSASDEGICVAVNYWYVPLRITASQHDQTTDNRSRYDMDFTGPLLPLASFVKSVYQSQKQ